MSLTHFLSFPLLIICFFCSDFKNFLVDILDGLFNKPDKAIAVNEDMMARFDIHIAMEAFRTKNVAIIEKALVVFGQSFDIPFMKKYSDAFLCLHDNFKLDIGKTFVLSRNDDAVFEIIKIGFESMSIARQFIDVVIKAKIFHRIGISFLIFIVEFVKQYIDHLGNTGYAILTKDVESLSIAISATSKIKGNLKDYNWIDNVMCYMEESNFIAGMELFKKHERTKFLSCMWMSPIDRIVPEDDDDSDRCLVCWAHKPNVTLINCGHGFCVSCILFLERDPNTLQVWAGDFRLLECSKCRKPYTIDDVQHYIPFPQWQSIYSRTISRPRNQHVIYR